MKTYDRKLTEVEVVAHGTGGYALGQKVTPRQMQNIAQSNGLETHALAGEWQDMAGLKVTINDMHPESGWVDAIPHFEQLAARVGAVIQHPEPSSRGLYSRASYFVYPTITPHKGGRNVKKSTDVTPTTAKLLDALRERGVSLGDLVEEAAKVKAAELGIE